MLSKLISVIFAVIAGAAALIGLSTGNRMITSSRNEVKDDASTTRAIPQTTRNGATTDSIITEPPEASEGSSPSPIFTVQGESAESTSVAQTSGETAIDLDPSPAPAAPAASTSAPAPEVSTAPAPSTSAPAPAPVAPAASAPAQPVKAMW